MRPVFLVLRSGADDGAGPVQRGGSGGSVIIYFPRFPSKRFAFGRCLFPPELRAGRKERLPARTRTLPASNDKGDHHGQDGMERERE